MAQAELRTAWGGHPAGTVVATAPGDGVALVVDPLRYKALLNLGLAGEGAREPEPEVALAPPLRAPRRRRPRGGAA